MTPLPHNWRDLPPEKARCHYCGRLTFPAPVSPRMKCAIRTRDHITPKFKGGSDQVIACNGCNSIKGGTPASVFQFFVDSRREEFSGMTNATRSYLHDRYLQFSHDATEAGFSLLLKSAVTNSKPSGAMTNG